MESTISLLDIFKILLKRWKLILLITIMAGFVSSILTYYFMTPVYQASTQILVNQKNPESNFDYSLLQGNVDLINTYSVIIKSPAILEKVINKLELKQNVEELNKNITISNKENSQVFTLTVQDHNLANAVEIVNTISETFQQEIKGIMNVDNVSILAIAGMKSNPVPVSPRPFLNIAVAVVIGLMFGIGASFLLEYMDNSLKNEKDVAVYLGLPVLGSVQALSGVQKKGIKGPNIQNAGSETVVTYAKK